MTSIVVFLNSLTGEIDVAVTQEPALLPSGPSTPGPRSELAGFRFSGTALFSEGCLKADARNVDNIVSPVGSGMMDDL